MTSLFPLNAFARAVVNRLLDLGVIGLRHYRSVHVFAIVMRLCKIIAVEPEIAGVRVGAKATAGAIVFYDVSDTARACTNL